MQLFRHFTFRKGRGEVYFRKVELILERLLIQRRRCRMSFLDSTVDIGDISTGLKPFRRVVPLLSRSVLSL